MLKSSSRLIERTGPSPGSTFDLTKDVTTLGRDVTNDIVVADAEVSRQHARISRTPGGFVLEDLGSTNGSFVNGERLTAPRVLNAGDLIGLGENVTFTYDVVSVEDAATVAAAASQPPPPPDVPAHPAAGPSPPAVPVPPPPAEAAAAAAMETPSQNRIWLLAGCGCVLAIVGCVAVLGLIDYFRLWDVILAPLETLGISF